MDSKKAGELVLRALAGDGQSVRLLIDGLTPAIQAQVAFAVMRHRRQTDRRQVAQECEDLTQEVFICLFEHGGKALRSWDASRGLGLVEFVRLLADRVVHAVMRSGRRNPWSDELVADEQLETLAGIEESFEPGFISRDLAERIGMLLRERLTPGGVHLFVRLFVNDEPAEQVAADEKLSMDAVYAWRSRLRRAVLVAAKELMSEAKPSRTIKV